MRVSLPPRRLLQRLLLALLMLPLLLLLPLLLVLSVPLTATASATATATSALSLSLPDVDLSKESLDRLVFASCHKHKRPNPQIWQSIANLQPQALAWTGDAVYPPVRGLANLTLLTATYQHMLTSDKLGYKQHILDNHKLHKRVFGTWDDHDYGANDMGSAMPHKQQRAQLYRNFVGQPPLDRQGVYSSVVWGKKARQVQMLLLDTRWHRQEYCIPSLATRIPLGAGIACLTRWLTAGLFSGMCPQQQDLLGSDQWEWLDAQLSNTHASLTIIVSSIQVFTTNPTLESWGHFPAQLARLLHLVNKAPGAVLFLSGDVHYAEILDPLQTIHHKSPKSILSWLSSSTNQPSESNSNNNKTLLEVTSSGLTHTCHDAVYGFMCTPLLQLFKAHRHHPLAYSSDKNFGSLQIDWLKSTYTVNIHDTLGQVLLSTGARPMVKPPAFTPDQIDKIAHACWNGHLQPFVQSVLFVLSLLYIIYYYSHQGRIRYTPSRPPTRKSTIRRVKPKKE
jgi:alkaline phosphatase D